MECIEIQGSLYPSSETFMTIQFLHVPAKVRSLALAHLKKEEDAKTTANTRMQPKISMLLIFQVLIDNTLNRAAIFFTAIPTYTVLPYSRITCSSTYKWYIKLDHATSNQYIQFVYTPSTYNQYQYIQLIHTTRTYNYYI